MKSVRSKIQNITVMEWILLVILLITFILTIRVNRNVSLHILDNDASSEMVLGHLLHEERSVYSKDWNYSTEISLHNQLVFALLFNIFEGWANVRFIGTTILQAFFLLSFIYMLSQTGLSKKAVLIGSILIMMPYCICYGRIVLYHCYYIPHYGFGFFIIGLLFSFIKRPHASLSSKIMRMVLFTLISFINSLLYVRQIIITIIPVIGCLFFYFLSHSDLKKTYQKWMPLTLLMAAAGLAGMICNTLFLVPALNLYRQTDQIISILPPKYWEPILEAFVLQFGFRPGAKIFSLSGILSLGGLFNAFILIGFSFYTLFRNDGTGFRQFVLQTMLPVNLLINFVIFFFGDIPFRLEGDYSRYFLSAAIWIAPLLCCRIDSEKGSLNFRRIVFSVCALIFAGNGLFNIRSFLNQNDFQQPYDGIVFNNPHQVDDMRSALEYIRAHDYSLGYAFISDANVLTEMLNGLPVVSLSEIHYKLIYSNWLTRKSWKDIPAENAFLLMTEEMEKYHRNDPALRFAERLYFDDRGYVIYDISDLDSFRNEVHE